VGPIDLFLTDIAKRREKIETENEDENENENENSLGIVPASRIRARSIETTASVTIHQHREVAKCRELTIESSSRLICREKEKTGLARAQKRSGRE